jgi:hypothetical protein
MNQLLRGGNRRDGLRHARGGHEYRVGVALGIERGRPRRAGDQPSLMPIVPRELSFAGDEEET